MATKRQLVQRWHEEPGQTIRQRIVDFCRLIVVGHNQTADQLFELLDGLPNRDEVPNGRDLRGNGWVDGRDMDFSNSDFSFSPTIGDFFYCDLRGSCFDELVTEGTALGDKLDGSSFRKSRMRRCFLWNSSVRNCCFDGADLRDASFKESDLSGSAFRNAKCGGAIFYNANLAGCDFRGADLKEAVFIGAKVHKSTDFRGASLVNAYCSDDYDKAGNLRARGIDLRQATFDETTKFGTDPLLGTIEYWDAIMDIARRDYGDDGAVIAAALEAIKQRIVRAGIKSMTWQDELLAKLNDRHRELYERIADVAMKSLL